MSEFLSTVEAYDPSSDSWTMKASNAHRARRWRPESRAAFCTLSRIGGPDYDFVATVEAYDPASNTWARGAQCRPARYQMAVGVVNGILYRCGGILRVAPSRRTVGERTTGTTTWTTTAPMPDAPIGLAVAVVNGIFYNHRGADESGIRGAVEA